MLTLTYDNSDRTKVSVNATAKMFGFGFRHWFFFLIVNFDDLVVD